MGIRKDDIMDERRKHRRLPIKIELAINELFRQDNEIINDIKFDAYVVNISRDGIGFESKAVIPISYYFDVRIDLSEKDFFYCVVKIIRIEDHKDYYVYGCEFVGLAGFLADKVDTYEHLLSEQTEVD